MKAKLIAVMAALTIAHLAAANNQTGQHHSDPSRQSAESSGVSLTKSQAEAAGMIDIVANFEKIDANKDGVITRNEWRAHLLATRRHGPMT